MARTGVEYSYANGTVSPVHVLYSEVLSVTSVMRKNSRWSSSSQTYNTRDSALATNLGLRRAGASSGITPRQGSEEEELMSAFEVLKRELRSLEDIENVPITTLLAPFFAIIRSPLATGPIASAALSALHSFFVCGLLSANSVSIDSALTDLTSAISHCKFEASDSSGDEVVLLRILTVIEDCLCGSLGSRLDDVEVCEMLETVLTTCVQMRLSEALRRSAESTMHQSVRTVFSRLHSLDPDTEERKLARAQEVTASQTDMAMSPALTPDVLSKSAALTADPNQSATSPPVQEVPKSDYGVPSLVELLRVVINILDPNERVHTDSTRLLALGILNTVFEVSGPRLGEFPSLRAMIIDHGCKYLFQLARSENPSILHLALRTITTMMNTMRKYLKLQQELFLSFTLDRLAPPAAGKFPKLGTPLNKGGPFSPRVGTTRTFSPLLEPVEDGEAEKGSPTPNRPSALPARGETRELLLETLCQISRHPGFMVELFVNYDCDSNSENLFERLIDMLTKSVYSEYYGDALPFGSLNSQYLCLDLLLAFVNHMTMRTSNPAATWPQDLVSPDDLMRSKSQKQLIQSGLARFNAKPKTGLAFLEENGLIYQDVTPGDAPADVPKVTRAQSLAKFLKSSTRLDKKVLGDFLSRPENIDLLKAFIGLINFEGKDIADAMRELLECFRLPGEAQQIDRITSTFAEIYWASGPAGIKSQDAIYVLSFSVIMLNTDLHNPQVRKRMTIEDYQRNLRGVNDGSDFSPEFLQNVYESIRKREIVLPDEHTGQLGFAFAWKELLMRSRQSGDLIITKSPAFDKEVFKSVWKAVITAITYAFMTFDDDYIIERAIAGFRQCATLAGHFHLPDVFDYVVVSLSSATDLLSDNLMTEVPVFPVVEVEGQPITVSSLAVKFGANLKGQLAAVVLFNIMNRNGNAIREGWTQVFEIFQNLFIHSLLPTRMLQMEDFLGGTSMIPLRGNNSQLQRPQTRHDGLLSTLSSYLMAPYGGQEQSIPNATDSDIENTLCALDCINTCHLEELYAQITQLELEPLVAAVRSLEALAYERTVARLQQESDDASSESQMPPLDAPVPALSYDPASVFVLEMMVSVVCRSPQHIEELWPIVFEHISALLSSSTRYSVLLIERAVVSLLRICLILATKPTLRDQIYISFDLLGGLSPVVTNLVAEQVISGLVLIVQNCRDVISSQTEWNLVLALVRATTPHQEAARTAFELVQRLVADGPEQCVTADNVLPLVAVLDDFAGAAGIAVEVELQHHGRRRPKPDSATSPIIDRGKRAVDLVFDVMKMLSRIVSEQSSDRWQHFAVPILACLSHHATSASLEVRHTALSQLTRALLGPLVPAAPNNARVLFQRVLYPLLDALIEAPRGQDTTEMRVRAAGLLCKAFMRFEVGAERADDDEAARVQALWVQILDYLDQLLRVDPSDQMAEAVPESLKNVILVMNAAGMLVPEGTAAAQRELWAATHARIEQFLPGFLESVVPAPPSPPPVPAPDPIPATETPAGEVQADVPETA